MKCLYCVKSILLGKIKLADGYIHKSCFRKLGFLDGYDDTMDNTPFAVVKDGYDVYMQRVKDRYWEKNDDDLEAAKKKILEEALSHGGVSVANYGQERDLICTEEERQIYDGVCRILDDDKPRLVRTSDSYVTIKYGEYDLMRLKYTNRARWFNFPMLERGDMKHYIEDMDDLDEYTVVIQDSLAKIKEFSGE